MEEVKLGIRQPLVEATSEEPGKAPEWRAHTTSGALAKKN